MNTVRTHFKPGPSISRTKVFAAPRKSPIALSATTRLFFATAHSKVDACGLDHAIDGGVELTFA
jgi:hypothetical protein